MHSARSQNILQPVTTIKVIARLSWSRPGIAYGFGFDVSCLCVFASAWLCVTFFGTLKDLPPPSWLRCLFVLLLLPGAVGHCNNCSCTFTICTWRVWLWCGSVRCGYSGLIKMSVGNANINFTISDVQLCETPSMSCVCVCVCVSQDKRNGCTAWPGSRADSRQQTNHQKYASNEGACQRKRK